MVKRLPAPTHYHHEAILKFFALHFERNITSHNVSARSGTEPTFTRSYDRAIAGLHQLSWQRRPNDQPGILASHCGQTCGLSVQSAHEFPRWTAQQRGDVAKASTETLKLGEALVLRGDPSRKLPACAACHGSPLTGVAPAIPGLLGLPTAYLSAQLGAWRAGQRHAQSPDCMGEMAEALSPQDVNAVTAWLSSQPVPSNSKPTASIAALGAPLPLRCGGVPQ